MPTAWGGIVPTQTADTTDYAMGFRCIATEDLTITGVLVYSGATPTPFPGRLGKVWSLGGAQLGVADLPDTLSPGWVMAPLAANVAIDSGQEFVVSFDTGGFYAALIGGISAPVPSLDGAVIVNAGRYGFTPGAMPDNESATYYGVDFEYFLGHGSNTAPEVTGISAVITGQQVAVTATVIDPEGLTGASYRWNFGDGTSDVVTTVPTANHTYASGGVYAVTVIVTDSADAYGFRSIVVSTAVSSGASGIAPAELAALRSVTTKFIQADDRSIVLVPHAFVRQPNGGRRLTALAPRLPQTMRLIPMSHTERPASSSSAASGADGSKQRKHDYTLLADWNAVIGLNDQWTDDQGVAWIVDELVPTNGYERKAMVTRYTEVT